MIHVVPKAEEAWGSRPAKQVGEASAGKLYRLPHVVLFAIPASLAGANSYRSVHAFIEVHLSHLRRIFGLTWRKAPAHTTIRWILQQLDPASVEHALRAHAAALARQAKGAGHHVAIDGKALRGSFDNFEDRKAAHVLSAFAPGLALTLAHLDCGEKSNEIPAVQDLVAVLGLPGAQIRVDAMQTFKAATGAGHHLIAQVKDNQPTLLQAVAAHCGRIKPRDSVRTIDEGRLRDETRTYEVFALDKVLEGSDWKDHVAAVIRVTRQTNTRSAATGLWRRSREISYYVCDVVVSAERAAHAIRHHWGIENRLHYVRDGSFAEDASRIRKNPAIFARLRSFALNILRFNKVENIAAARYRIAIGGIAALRSIRFL